MVKRILVLLTAAMVALSMTAGAALAHDNGGKPHKGKDKVCVQHKAGKSGKYVYISIPKKAYKKGHKKHGDKIVSSKKCEKKNDGKKDKDKKNKKKFKKGKKKFPICHKPGTPAEKTLYLPKSAFKGHLGHGDVKGKCPPKEHPKNAA